MNDFVTQRFDLARRVQFKFQLEKCYICADVYHREREFLVFAAEELYRTAYAPPVSSEERIGFEDFLRLLQPGPEEGTLDSYESCFQQPVAEETDTGLSPLSYLSCFSVASLSLVTRERVLDSLPKISVKKRATVLLYLMGVRTYMSLAQVTGSQEDMIKELLYRGRRELQQLVCSDARPHPHPKV